MDSEEKQFNSRVRELDLDEWFGYVEYDNLRPTFEGNIVYSGGEIIVTHTLYSDNGELSLNLMGNSDKYEWILDALKDEFNEYKDINIQFYFTDIEKNDN